MPNNLLIDDPRKPKHALKLASEKLANVASTAGKSPRLTYILKVGGKDSFDLMDYIEARRQAVISEFKKYHGRNFGPVQNAVQYIDTYLKKALVEGYNLDDEHVINAFMYFLLALVTEGFEDEDCNGTQMGGYKGDWGGFFKY